MERRRGRKFLVFLFQTDTDELQKQYETDDTRVLQESNLTSRQPCIQNYRWSPKEKARARSAGQKIMKPYDALR